MKSCLCRAPLSVQTLEEGFVADSSWGWLGRIAASSQVRHSKSRESDIVA